jgi:hypothetical protein
MGQRPGHSNSHRTTRCLSDGSSARRVLGSSCRAVRFGGTCGTCLRFIRLGPGRSPRSSRAPFGNQTPDRGFRGIRAVVHCRAVPWNLRSDCSNFVFALVLSSLVDLVLARSRIDQLLQWQALSPRQPAPWRRNIAFPGWPRKRRRGSECAQVFPSLFSA